MKYKRVVCQDGFEMSVQAGPYIYSHPSADAGSYKTVEVGFPKPSDSLLKPYGDGDDIFAYVPVWVVTMVIAKHGGMLSGTVPKGVIPLKA